MKPRTFNYFITQLLGNEKEKQLKEKPKPSRLVVVIEDFQGNFKSKKMSYTNSRRLKRA